ncbi:MAG: hypothetical protein ACRD0P_33935, partial [Stackebrandtia sp.]
ALAEPDPWYGMEMELLLDLFDHHPEVLAALRHRVRHTLPSARNITPLRIDRHGVIVSVGDETPSYYHVPHRHGASDLPQLLNAMTCRGCPGR